MMVDDLWSARVGAHDPPPVSRECFCVACKLGSRARCQKHAFCVQSQQKLIKLIHEFHQSSVRTVTNKLRL